MQSPTLLQPQPETDVTARTALSEAVITDVRHLLAHGEWELAFDTMCSWIYEDALPITPQYHARLVAMAEEMGTPGSVERLDELLR